MLRIGYLTQTVDDTLVDRLVSMNAAEICPHGRDVTPENVAKWHVRGLNVRAWGISDNQIMKKVYDAGADGMTVNFPDLLLRYIEEKSNSQGEAKCSNKQL